MSSTLWSFMRGKLSVVVPILNVLVGANFSLILISSELYTSFPCLYWDFPVLSYEKTSQHSKWMDNLNVDQSIGWILSCFFECEAKIHKPKQWINQVCKEIHTATLGMKLTSVVCKLEIKINLSKSKVKLHSYSKSIYTTKSIISPFLKINIHHQMLKRPPTPTPNAPPARTWSRGLQHVNWVCRPLHHQSLTLSS